MLAIQKVRFKGIVPTPYKKAKLAANFTKISLFFIASLLLLSTLGVINGTNVVSALENSPDAQSAFVLTSHDMDDDGLNDTLENMLGTDNDSKYGDKDGDGLYDFEEYLDIYGKNDSNDPKYKYNDSTSYNGTNGPILDLYHHFNLSANKTQYLRDTDFTNANGGFTDTLLWNVTFSENYAGGNSAGVTTYSNNFIIASNFSGFGSGGSTLGTTYVNNTILSTHFSGDTSGGSVLGFLNYSNNFFMDCSFSGLRSGSGADDNLELGTSFSENMFINTTFSGAHAGSSLLGPLRYYGNTFQNVNFSGLSSGGASSNHKADPSDSFEEALVLIYDSNIFEDVNFSGERAGAYGHSFYLNSKYSFLYRNNSFTNVDFNGPKAGSAASGLALLENNRYKNVRFSGGAAGGLTTAVATSIEYRNNSFEDVIFSGATSGGATSQVIYVGNTFNNVSFEGKDSGLSEKKQTIYSNNSFTDVKFNVERLLEINSNFSDNEFLGYTKDTDGDGIPDVLEQLQSGTSVDKTDTDGDGLPDAWETKYNGSPGVNPLVNATEDELASDTDGDGLTLLEEAEGNTNPNVFDSIPINSSSSTDSSSDGTTSDDNLISLVADYTLFIYIGIGSLIFLIIAFFVLRRLRR